MELLLPGVVQCLEGLADRAVILTEEVCELGRGTERKTNSRRLAVSCDTPSPSSSASGSSVPHKPCGLTPGGGGTCLPMVRKIEPTKPLGVQLARAIVPPGRHTRSARPIGTRLAIRHTLRRCNAGSAAGPLRCGGFGRRRLLVALPVRGRPR